MTDNSVRRVAIECVTPIIDGGRFPIKRVVGDTVSVQADVFADGHDMIIAVLLHRHEQDLDWTQSPMQHLKNDRWHGEFIVEDLGQHYYSLLAWLDLFQTWRRDLAKKHAADLDVEPDLLIGLGLIEDAQRRGSTEAKAELERWAEALRVGTPEDRIQAALDDKLAALMLRFPDVTAATRYARDLEVVVDPVRARFSTWYEMFPRSACATPDRHGTFRDCEARLPYIAAMGFDVLYLPPIHPIGRTNRKGRNNSIHPEPGDPGSPWAIGSAEGGHKSVHPELGTLDDFCHLVESARTLGIEVALDLAFQASPDHPYVQEHRNWFHLRPDGTIQFAENPPKKYEDIYPFDFESADRQTLWEELESVVLFWIEQEVRIFRVDNPHTKPFQFWEWLITRVKRGYPEIIFLSEAFTRPKVLRYLAKLGFSQSYTYFTWRNTKPEIVQYLAELTRGEVAEYLRPNFWPNTPDILAEQLQFGGRAGFQARLVLAATLGSSYGIYGPPYELCVDLAKEAGSEEYDASEKYEIRRWNIDDPASLADFIARINRIRRDNPALQSNANLKFLAIENDYLLAYSKSDPHAGNTVLCVVNLDTSHTQSGWVKLPLDDFGLSSHQSYQVHDLLSDARYLWNGSRNYVEVNPHVVPAQIFAIRRRVRTEQHFEYFT